MARCSVCKKDVPPRPGNRSFPFCSHHCKLVDLGKWLGEEYRVPVQRVDEDEEHAEPAESQRRPMHDDDEGLDA
jgi:uncharacterized protein